MDVDMDDKTKTYNGCIRIAGLHTDIRIPHIMKMLNSASLKLQHPAKCHLQESKGRNYCTLQLKSKKDAQKFINKFNGQNVRGKELKVEMSKPHRSFSPESIKRVEASQCLIISNLPSNATDQQLMDHIRKKSKKIPKSIQVQHHQKTHVKSTEAQKGRVQVQQGPARAFVEMKSSKEAQIVMKEAQMSTLDGQQMWIEQIVDKTKPKPRNEKLKGSHDSLIIENVPPSWKKKQIREMCAKHGGKVKSVSYYPPGQMYTSRNPIVKLSSNKEASALFDTLNGKKVEGCVLRTIYYRPRARAVTVRLLQKNTSIKQVIDHIKKNADIDIKAKDTSKSSKDGTDFVKFKYSNLDDASKLAKALHSSKFKSSKLLAVKRWRANKSGPKPKMIKKGGSSGKGKLTAKGKKGGKAKMGGKQKKNGGIKKTVKV